MHVLLGTNVCIYIRIYVDIVSDMRNILIDVETIDSPRIISYIEVWRQYVRHMLVLRKIDRLP